jgi:hypothetical protein
MNFKEERENRWMPVEERENNWLTPISTIKRSILMSMDSTQ